jgi:hypothetical protein
LLKKRLQLEVLEIDETVYTKKLEGEKGSSDSLQKGTCWKYALEPTGFDSLVGSDGFDPLWCKSPNGPQML